jgi:soluble lytic murein transglycosylase-like protein
MQKRYKSIFTLLVSAFTWGGVSEARYLDVLQLSYKKLNYRSMKTEGTLEKINVDDISPDEEKAVALFSRGLLTLDENPREAVRNFTAAKKILSENSPLYSLVSIYHGRAALNKSNARKILSKLNAMTNGNIKKSPMWRPEKFALMIEIVMLLEQDHLLVRAWNDMNSKVKPAMRDESLAPRLISYLEHRKLPRRPELWPLVESLASEYPHGVAGRWAFQKLQELSCVRHKPYIYSLSLISRLAANVNLDEGLKDFLIELTDGQVRFNSRKVGRMDEFERINYLYQNRFWNEARRLIEDRMEASPFSQGAAGKVEHAKFLNLLGQIQTRQGDYESSIKTWSLYVDLFKDEADTRLALENIADGLAKLRHHRQAAKIYGALGQSSKVDPVVRWHHFWNLYLAGELSEALALLDRGDYVPLRDRTVEGGLDYWRARILERQNKTTEADDIYKKILQNYGDNFYSALVLARKPALLDAIRRSTTPTIPLVYQSIKLTEPMARLAGETVVQPTSPEILPVSLDVIPDEVDGGLTKKNPHLTPEQETQMRMASALGKWGQNRLARRVLRLIPVAPRKGGEGYWVPSFRLAMDLKDYAYGFKASQMTDSPLRRTPSSTADLEVHMLQYNSDWRLLYPYAYRDIVNLASSEAGVDPFLILSLMRAESVYDEDAESHVGAQGLMQIMPFTAIRLARVMQDHQFELDHLHQPEINISYAAYYLRMLTQYYRGNTVLAVAAYNGGPTAVDRWLSTFSNLELDEFVETISFRETRRYVKTVFRNFNYYKFIWQQKRALAELPLIPKTTTGNEIF